MAVRPGIRPGPRRGRGHRRARGGLLLDTREAMLHGGNSGPAIVPGDRLLVEDAGKGAIVVGSADWLAGTARRLHLPGEVDRLPAEMQALGFTYFSIGR